MANTHQLSPQNVVAELRDNAFKHALVGEDPSYEMVPEDGIVYACEDRYSHHVFRGILPDTGATGASNAGLPQVQAILAMMPSLKIEDAPAATINFGQGSAPSITAITVPTILGTIRFRVLPTHTLFSFQSPIWIDYLYAWITSQTT